MSLRDEIQADIAAAFDDDLADAVRQFTLTRTVRGGYDPVTGQETVSTEIFDSRGVFGRFKQEEVDQQHILATDERLLVLQSEIATAPKVGDEVGNKRVLNVFADPAAATWTLQLRDA